MNYELAKELKDAGFETKAKCSRCIGDHKMACSKDIFPTLEELLEACGQGFDSLYKDEEMKWYARRGNTVIGVQIHIGSTPTEAVARLWLALQDTKN